jgi:hypothetical protein
MEDHASGHVVRILAARFADREHATQALESLNDRLEQPVEAEIAPLAPTSEAAAEDTLLAGQFAEELMPRVEEIIHQSGGEIVADVDERATRPRTRVAAGHEQTRYC